MNTDNNVSKSENNEILALVRSSNKKHIVRFGFLLPSYPKKNSFWRHTCQRKYTNPRLLGELRDVLHHHSSFHPLTYVWDTDHLLRTNTNNQLLSDPRHKPSETSKIPNLMPCIDYIHNNPIWDYHKYLHPNLLDGEKTIFEGWWWVVVWRVGKETILATYRYIRFRSFDLDIALSDLDQCKKRDIHYILHHCLQ